MDYLIIIEATKSGFSAYAPDLPGCIATGPTADKTMKLMREAMNFHLEGMLTEGYELPQPSAGAAFFQVKAGKVTDLRSVETLYDIKTFASKLGISPSTARVYAHRYNIGRKLGRGWVFSDKDVAKLPAHA